MQLFERAKIVDVVINSGASSSSSIGQEKSVLTVLASKESADHMSFLRYLSADLVYNSVYISYSQRNSYLIIICRDVLA